MSIKVGIIGGGKFGLMHLRTFTQLRSERRVESVALAEINEAFDVVTHKEEHGAMKVVIHP